MTELEVIVQMDKLQSTYCFSATSASIIRSYWKNFETSRNRNVIKIQIAYGISENGSEPAHLYNK